VSVRPAASSGRSETEETWHRLSPLSPLVNLGRMSLALAIVAAPALAGGRGSWGFLFYVPLFALGVVGGFVSWLVTRWRVRGGVLEKEQGLIRRESLRFPLTQVQAIDIVRPGTARLLGLAELRLRMGGSTGGAARLAYLPARQAGELRTRLLGLARALEEEPRDALPGAVAEEERVIVTTPTGRLLASLALSTASLPLLVLLVLTIEFAGYGGGLVDLFAAAAALWRRFNGEYHLTVAEATDGLRLRGGLVATNAETIRAGRVQAVKMVEPLLWRPFGWCRLQVDLAGRQHAEGESTTQRRPARTLLPVGSRRQANELLKRLLSDLPVERSHAPRRARWKTPLRYHNLSWGRTDGCVVTTTGRATRVTAWVPMEKVQSLRQVEGPVQRRLRLRTIHLDTAGRGVRAALRERDRDEADAALAELVALSRRARSSRSIAAVVE
jgi:putative membrane protein